MSKILHIVIVEKYVEGYNYNQNTFPAKHAEQGHEVHIITTSLTLNKNNGITDDQFFDDFFFDD